MLLYHGHHSKLTVDLAEFLCEPSQISAVGDCRVEDDAGLIRIVAEVEEDHRFEVVGCVEVPSGNPVEHEIRCDLGLRRVNMDIASCEVVQGLCTQPRRLR